MLLHLHWWCVPRKSLRLWADGWFIELAWGLYGLILTLFFSVFPNQTMPVCEFCTFSFIQNEGCSAWSLKRWSSSPPALSHHLSPSLEFLAYLCYHLLLSVKVFNILFWFSFHLANFALDCSFSLDLLHPPRSNKLIILLWHLLQDSRLCKFAGDYFLLRLCIQFFLNELAIFNISCSSLRHLILHLGYSLFLWLVVWTTFWR